MRSSDAVRIHHRELDATPDAEAAFAELFGDREHAFWLDSSLVDPQLSRFSFMGAAVGELGAQVRYDVRERRVTVTRDGATQTHDETLFEYLSRELARLHTTSPELPFDLNGGFVGYLGYECKADCGARDAHRAQLPDGFLLLADRIVAIDHELGRTHLLALSPQDATAHDAERWLDAAAAALAAPARARAARAGRGRLPSSSSSRAAASTTWRTSRPASACSRPARATRSA